MLSGENGILKQAAKAKTSTDVGKLSESIKLAATTVMTSKEHKLTKEEFKKELEVYGYKINEEDGTVTMNGQRYAVTSKGAIELSLDELKKEQAIVYTNTKIEDKNGYQITIPMNFNISLDSPVLVTEGIVIEDNEDNQYVWIPVFTSEQKDWGAVYPDTLPAKTAKESEFTDDNVNAIKTALRGNSTSGYTKTYYDSYSSDLWYGDSNYVKYGYYDGSKFVYYTNGNMDEATYNKLYRDMLISVYKNGGFYIGRYEMGTAVVNSVEEAQSNTRTKVKEYTPSTATSGTTTNNAAAVKIGSKPVIKANAVPYNYITQSQAQMLAESLNYSSVKSSLMH